MTGAVALPGWAAVAQPATQAAGVQNYWGYCTRCFAMFYFRDENNLGVCMRGGWHHNSGLNFSLSFGGRASADAQGDWRHCGKCRVMFYDGYVDKGRCAAGGAHAAEGLSFVLPHDISVRPGFQGEWRYCRVCRSLFFDGNVTNGVCPGPQAGHVKDGFMFVLPHL